MPEEKKETTILVFSAELQKETPHTLDIDGNGEVVLTCTVTGRFIKFPKGTTGSALKESIAKHKAAHEGRVTVAEIEKNKSDLLAAFEHPDADAVI